MKIKLFFSAVIMAIAMTACTSDEVVMTPETAGTPISFQAVTNNMTRAGYTFCQNDQPLGFYVGAFQGTVNYFDPDNIAKMDNITRTTQNGTWTSSETRYWPKYGTLNFYAFLHGDPTTSLNYSVAADNTNDDVTVTLPNYTIKDELDKQTDLMYAITKDAALPAGTTTTSYAVTLNFLHALSQICFEAKREDTSSTFKISDIQVTGVMNQGTFTFDKTSTEQGNEEHSSSTTTTYPSTHQGVWSELGTYGTPEYTLTIDNTIPNTVSESDKHYYQCNLSGTTNEINISNPNKYTDHNPDGSNSTNYAVYKNRVMNLLPQPLDSSTAKITVWFYVNDDPNQKSVDLPISGTWVMGKRYIYTLTFTKGASISYTTTIADFDNDEPSSPTL